MGLSRNTPQSCKPHVGHPHFIIEQSVITGLTQEGKEQKLLVVPEGITSIGWCAFVGCSSLASVELPDSLTSIRKHAFYNCSSLTSVELPDALASIGDWAFCGCSSLTNIELPDSLASFGSMLSVAVLL